MGAALVGLLGVIVGALLSGAITWWQARRVGAAERRAAARLVEAELRLAAGRLQWLRATLMPDVLGDVSAEDRREALALLAELPPPSAWPEHRQLLAKTLGSADWYAVAQAYEAWETLRSPLTAAAMTQDRGGVQHPFLSQAMDGYMIALWSQKVLDGTVAVSRLAASAERPGGEEAAGFYDEMLGSLRGSTIGPPPALRRDRSDSTDSS